MTGVTDTNLMSVRKRSFDAQDLLCEAGKLISKVVKIFQMYSLTELVNDVPINRKIFILNMCHSGKIQKCN